MARHRYPWTRSELRAAAERLERLWRREAAAASWGAVLAATAHTLAADRHGRVNDETTVTLPIIPAERVPDAYVPAVRDAHARLGLADYLNDTDEAWRDRHKTAMERTQPLDPEARRVAVAASGSGGGTAETPVPLWEAIPQPEPTGPTAAPLAPGPVAVVPYRDLADPDSATDPAA